MAVAVVIGGAALAKCGGLPREEALYKGSELNCLNLAYSFHAFRKSHGEFPDSFSDVFPLYVEAPYLICGRFSLDGPSPQGLIEEHPTFVDYLCDYNFLTKDGVILVFEKPRLWERTHTVAYAEVDSAGEVVSRGRSEASQFWRDVQTKGYGGETSANDDADRGI